MAIYHATILITKQITNKLQKHIKKTKQNSNTKLEYQFDHQTKII